MTKKTAARLERDRFARSGKTKRERKTAFISPQSYEFARQLDKDPLEGCSPAVRGAVGLYRLECIRTDIQHDLSVTHNFTTIPK